MDLLILRLIISAFSTFSLAEATKSNNVTLYTQELLSVTMPICNDKVGLSCPSSKTDRDNRMFFCRFRCPQGTLYHCKEDTYHGIIEFCAKPEICDKGQMYSVYFDSEHQRVVIQKSTCPEGLFQPFEEDCYIACTQYHHVDESFLQDLGIVVLYHGNATHPGVGYCDVDNGYVNIDYNMYINLTQFEVSVCDKKENFQIKCDTGQRLLPDSRCVPVCEQGYVVNKKDFFKCSLHSSTDTV
ncbi:uncharacterized protein LOC128552190 [Mercenaria mercenaria]|uniref:uncharacterized protein LOC128552190 n=1 Tax=Mercenaria mercenaria TaxID=6596 RepID=UPI00234F26D8|nr:uncharacterized protein LOC128552190 [Mercenaria mercenaria]